MLRLRSLRSRLVVGMLLVLALALGVSTALDLLGAAAPPCPATPHDMATDNEAYQDAWVLAGFSVPALLLIWLVSSWSLRPLARISQEARNIGPRSPAARLSPHGLPAEIIPLVDAVNGALNRMADAVAAERHFTENAAHELRTPLAVLGLRLQRARETQALGNVPIAWPDIDQDLANLNRLVSQMLDLARKENAGRGGPEQRHQVVNLSRIVREACALILPVAETHGRPLTVTTPDIASVAGDADDLRDAIVNLLENAVLHGRGRITLECGQDASQRHIVLSVSDEGPAIDVVQAHALFQRFHKGPRSQGSGLGLAIVSEVIRGHHGEVRFLPCPHVKIEIRLPMAHAQ